jgi:hypothetical protein
VGVRPGPEKRSSGRIKKIKQPKKGDKKSRKKKKSSIKSKIQRKKPA